MHCFVPAFHKYSEEQNADVGPMKVLQQMTFYNIAYLLCARHFFPMFFYSRKCFILLLVCSCHKNLFLGKGFMLIIYILAYVFTP